MLPTGNADLVINTVLSFEGDIGMPSNTLMATIMPLPARDTADRRHAAARAAGHVDAAGRETPGGWRQ